MKISIILAHPDPGSFNHAIAQAAAEALRGNGHEVRLRDLCAEQFDPLMPAAAFAKDAKLDATITQHCQEIAEADGIIVVHEGVSPHYRHWRRLLTVSRHASQVAD